MHNDLPAPNPIPRWDPKETTRLMDRYDHLFLTLLCVWWGSAGGILACASYGCVLGDTLPYFPSLCLFIFGVYFLFRGLGKFSAFRAEANNPLILPILSVVASTYVLCALAYLLFAPRSLTFALGGLIILLMTPPLVTPCSVLLFKWFYANPAEVARAYRYHQQTQHLYAR